MAQISRPFQIALVCALAIFALAWFVVLHRPGGSSSSSSSSPSVASSAGSSSPGASSAAGGSSAGGRAVTGSGHVYHGSAPGVEGLTRDIKRAHEAAAKEERVAPEPQVEGSHSPGASAVGGAAAGSSQGAAVGSSQGAAAAGSSQGAADATPTHAGAGSSKAASDPATAPSHTQTRNPGLLASRSASKTAPLAAQRTPPAQSGSAAAAPSNSAPAMQSVVAGELGRGKVVLLLFWNPHSSDDTAVNGQVQAVAHSLHGRVAVHTALAAQLQSFGSITRDIQIYSTPTLLIVNPKGQVTTLTGYTDAYAIEQAVAEARG
jgi:hypothetical protein